MAEVCTGLGGSNAWAHWVAAEPFRAHLAHVMAVGDMSVEVVAAMTGISARAANHLLRGRNGRPVRRISAETARRLLRLTSAEARSVRDLRVSARGAAYRVRELLAAGYPLATIASRSGVAERTVSELAAGRRDSCSALVAAQLTAAQTALDVGADLGCPLAS